MGWGHGSYQSCIEMADRVDAGKIIPYEPTRTDAELDAIYKSIVNQYNHVTPEMVIAQEGMVIDLESSGTATSLTPFQASFSVSHRRRTFLVDV